MGRGVTRFISRGGLTGIVNFRRTARECCPCNSLTSSIVKFVNRSSNLTNVRTCCGSRLANAGNELVATGSTGSGSVSGSCRAAISPRSNCSLGLAVGAAVRCCLRGRLREALRRCSTGNYCNIIVGYGANTILTVTSLPSCSYGRPCGVACRGCASRLSGVASTARGARGRDRCIRHR